VEVLAGLFYRWIQNDNPYSDVTGSPFKLPTESPTDLKWQIRIVMCRFFRQDITYFSFFFLIPTLLIYKQPAPLPSNKNLPHLSTTSYIF
jgi:hypothetical protein